MGKKYCSDHLKNAVEHCICNPPFKKFSVVTPYRVEKQCSIDHNITEACLEEMSPVIMGEEIFLPWEQRGEYICGSKDRQLIRAESSKKEWIIDDDDPCMIKAILETSKMNLSINEREEKTRDLVGRCIVKQYSQVKAGLNAITKDGELSTAVRIFAFGLIFAGCINICAGRKKFND